MNLALLSLRGGLLIITLTVPLKMLRIWRKILEVQPQVQLELQVQPQIRQNLRYSC